MTAASPSSPLSSLYCCTCASMVLFRTLEVFPSILTDCLWGESIILLCVHTQLLFCKSTIIHSYTEDIRFPEPTAGFMSLHGLLVGTEDLAQIKLLEPIRASVDLQGWRNVLALKTSKNNNRVAWQQCRQRAFPCPAWVAACECLPGKFRLQPRVEYGKLCITSHATTQLRILLGRSRHLLF